MTLICVRTGTVTLFQLTYLGAFSKSHAQTWGLSSEGFLVNSLYIAVWYLHTRVLKFGMRIYGNLRLNHYHAKVIGWRPRQQARKKTPKTIIMWFIILIHTFYCHITFDYLAITNRAWSIKSNLFVCYKYRRLFTFYMVFSFEELDAPSGD